MRLRARSIVCSSSHSASERLRTRKLSTNCSGVRPSLWPNSIAPLAFHQLPPQAQVTASVRVLTRSGAASATSWEIVPPIETPSRWKRSSPRWSASASVSAAMSRISYASSTYSERPMSRLSKTTVRMRSENAGTLKTQAWLSAASPITHSSAGSPSPWSSW